MVTTVTLSNRTYEYTTGHRVFDRQPARGSRQSQMGRWASAGPT